jgi:hypothetical protein
MSHQPIGVFRRSETAVLPPNLCAATMGPVDVTAHRRGQSDPHGLAQVRAPRHTVHGDGVVPTRALASGRSEKVGCSTASVEVSPGETTSGSSGCENKLGKSMKHVLTNWQGRPENMVVERATSESHADLFRNVFTIRDHR